MEKEKKQQEKKHYSLFSNYWFLYKGFFKNSKWNILFVTMILVGGIVSYYVQIYVPKVAVSLVMEQVSVQRLVGTLLGIELFYFLFSEIETVGDQLLNNPGLKYRHVLEERILYKICHTAYSNLEDPDYKNKIARAQQFYLHWDRDARVCIWNSLFFVHLLVTVIISSGVIAGLHPIVVAVLAAGTWLQYQLDKRPIAWEKKHIDSWQPLERKINYISEHLGNYSYAKELRLYAADKWLLPKYSRLLQERRQWKKRQRKQMLASDGAGRVVTVVKEVTVYGFLIWGVLTGRLQPDDFILYVGLALSLSSSLGQVAAAGKALRESELSVSDYREMMEMPDSRRRAESTDGVSEDRRAEGTDGVPEDRRAESTDGVPEDRRAESTDRVPEDRRAERAGEVQADRGEYVSGDEAGADNVKRGFGAAYAGKAPEVTFSHVSFTYPGAETETLKDVNIVIRPGEKVALVGCNGAGKTTLIKLLCGMYEPSRGEIFLDGKPASRCPLEEWYRLFSVVFQDIGVIPATIVENVAACAPVDADRERVAQCLEQAGLKNMVENLPHGMDTYLRKEMFKEGVNLSGGETQKLLLARAIYREAPVLVLDEPTAALDAIAENQLYLRYNELTRGRTSLFISHRLSSTQFCDRILMLEGGRIVEQGSHRELMEKKGAYYQLFQIQSHYYQNDRTEGFTSDMKPEWEVSSYVSR